MHLSWAAHKRESLHLSIDLTTCLAQQRQAHGANPYPSEASRRADLRQLQTLVRDNAEPIAQAISADYGHRSRHETLLGEVVPVIHAVDHALKHLKQWMKPQRRSVDWLNFFGAKNRVLPQPLGVVGVIVPWNFPINLSFMVLVDAFAAGNRAMVKMSENSRHLTRLLMAVAPRYFSADKLVFFEETGGVGVAFSQLKFDHLVFTGSTQTGKAVMAAAARNLCPVTLELGGKSPAVVCDDFELRTAVERIMFAKCFNAGQICTNVDHVYVPQHKVDEFVQLAQTVVQQRFANLDTPDYTSIIDARSFERLCDALQEAKAQGATLVPLLPGPAWDVATRKIAPHVVLHMPAGCALQSREIFGPILPVIGYTDLNEVVERINAGPHPLAFYPFTHSKTLVDDLIQRVMSGGVAVNDALFHVAQHSLPFGGVGESGMGHYHGHEGFVTFSKMRPVFYQARLSGMRLMWPPYRRWADKYLKFLLK
jgi:coniferyl-aldehyde dehydrogenase